MNTRVSVQVVESAVEAAVGALAEQSRGSEAGEAQPQERTETELEKEEAAYIQSLSPLEQHAMAIARDHLETSFSIARSNGFLAWKKARG